MKKITMLYDATLFARSYFDQGVRTGIFFAGYNIFKQFVNDDRFDITLYVHDEVRAVTFFKNDDLLSHFPVCINTEETKYNITVHKNNIKRTTKITKKILYSLKIVKNYLYLIFYHRNNSRLLENVDIYFSPMYTAPPEITKFPNIKHFIVLHDTTAIIYPQYFPEIISNDHWYNKLIESINKYVYYFCNSENTKNDFLKYYGQLFAENKITVIHHAASQCFYPDYNKAKLIETLRKYRIEYNKDNNYIFSFCTLEPRKNLPFTMRCFVKFIKKHSIDNLYFYLGGGQWDKFIHLLEEQIDNLNEYRDKIVRLGYVDDADVNILYSNSLFFTYISQYEGFGVPPLEAMQAGTPVITSNNSSLPEVVGDAAIMIDYDNEEQCIKAFEDFYFNENLRKYYIEKGLERAKLFSWEKTVDKMKEVIIEAVI
jgi:glycosyltransferase involved in cell wall biosynthesis